MQIPAAYGERRKRVVYAAFIVGVFSEQVGYQYTTFSGPVSGSAQEVLVPGPSLRGRATKAYDFVAKPDYAFSYGVEDPLTGNAQKREESRDGDVVTGEYSVVEPDGSVRTVYYRADSKNGFQATVEKSPAPATTHHAPPTQNQYSVVEPDPDAGPAFEYQEGPTYQTSEYQNGAPYQDGAGYQEPAYQSGAGYQEPAYQDGAGYQGPVYQDGMGYQGSAYPQGQYGDYGESAYPRSSSQQYSSDYPTESADHSSNDADY